MSYHAASRKLIASLAAEGEWSDADVVVSGTDARDGSVRISRAEAAVPAALVRRWLQVRNPLRQRCPTVVGSFVSADGYLFIPQAQPAP